jgi:hypothetical protein
MSKKTRQVVKIRQGKSSSVKINAMHEVASTVVRDRLIQQELRGEDQLTCSIKEPPLSADSIYLCPL